MGQSQFIIIWLKNVQFYSAMMIGPWLIMTYITKPILTFDKNLSRNEFISFTLHR